MSGEHGAIHQRLLTLWRMHTSAQRADGAGPEPVAATAVVVSLRALLEHTITPDDLRRRGRSLKVHDRVVWGETAAWLFDLGYEAVGDLDARQETFADWKEPFRDGVVYYLKGGRVRGVLLWNTFGKVDAARALIAQPGPFNARALKGRI